MLHIIMIKIGKDALPDYIATLQRTHFFKQFCVIQTLYSVIKTLVMPACMHAYACMNLCMYSHSVWDAPKQLNFQAIDIRKDTVHACMHVWMYTCTPIEHNMHKENSCTKGTYLSRPFSVAKSVIMRKAMMSLSGSCDCGSGKGSTCNSLDAARIYMLPYIHIYVCMYAC
jgi:hypothetical protein